MSPTSGQCPSGVTRQLKAEARAALAAAGHNLLAYHYGLAYNNALALDFKSAPARWAAAWAVVGMIKRELKWRHRS